MVNDIPWQLLEKYFAKESDPLECRKVEAWTDSEVENRMIFEQLQSYFQEYGSLPLEFVPDAKAALKKVSEKLPSKARVVQISGLWWKVAAVFVVGMFGWWLIHQQVKREIPEVVALFKTDTSRAGIVLPDGSKIWLNSHSSIKYPEKFNESTREVLLEGEAYFEIAHDSAHPFIVCAANTQTRVLGTKFDIRSYQSEKQVVVTVTEGRVGFSGVENKQVILNRNQKGTFDRQNQNVSMVENDNRNFLSWKTHEFVFEKQSLDNVFQTLSEVYHIKYQFQNSSVKDRLLTANFNNRPLDEIIQTISLSADVEISIEEGVYTIK